MSIILSIVLAVMMTLCVGSAQASHFGLAVENQEVFGDMPEAIVLHLWDLRHKRIEPVAMGRGADGTFFETMWVGQHALICGVFVPHDDYVVIEHITSVLVLDEDGQVVYLWSSMHA